MSWRWWLALVAGCLLLGLLALLWQADAALMRERQLRHAARAREVFAAMERELTSLLEQEENRPLEHYRYFYVPEDLVAGSVALSQSPLAVFPPPPPIRVYLRIDPDGELQSPHRPADRALARSRGWQPDPRVDRLLAGLAQVVGPTGSGAVAHDELAAEEPAVADDREMAPAAAPAPEAAAEATAPERDGHPIGKSAGDDFASRKGRRAVERQVQAQSIYNFEQVENRINQQLRQQEATDDAAPQLSAAAVEQDIQARLKVDPDTALRVTIEPMRGRELADGDLLLLRSVHIRGQEHRQGFVIDRAALQDRLAALPSADGELAAHVDLAWVGPAAGPYRFDYAFAEPFESLQVSLGLAPIPALVGSERLWLWSLGALLALLGLGAAAGIERMVELRLAFARRRQNFVAAVSHELKTPLTAIRMYAEMLGEGMVAEAQRQDYYRTIRSESERLSRMIGNVLELGKLERGVVDVQWQCGALRPVLDELATVLAPHLEQSGFAVEIDCPLEVQACFDRELLLQVLLNCCDNSLKFAAEADDKRIRITAERVQEGIRLSLRDFGPGVAPTHLPKIFESFYRGEEEQTRRHKGSGIGLALVRGLVERMRGQVEASNHPQGGFRVALLLSASAPS